MSAEHPYASFVHLVNKPARYVGGEFGERKKDWDAVSARVCLAFPDVYDIGMSHLGFKILYKILNDDPRTLAERCYAPWVDMERELRARKLPLVSLESARALRDFDVVGFSLQFELTYTNILGMLDMGGIPLRSEARGEDDPLVIAGGPVATHPEPISDFIDAIVIGDGEERTTDLALTWTALKKEGRSRKERLVAIAKLQGVYVPSLYDVAIQEDTGFAVVTGPKDPASGIPSVVRRNLVADLNRFPFPDDSPVGGPEAIFDRMSIEIARGCTEGCRFCQAGMIYRPVRERDPDAIIESVTSAIKKSGYDEVSLTSLSTADYSCIAPLIQKVSERMSKERVALGVSSLRAYGLEENVLDDIQTVRASGVTFAPEAGSQRMRDVVNKNVTEEQLMTTAERIFARGWNSMKLYFMIGLPTEEESDVREIVRVGQRAWETGKRVKKEKKAGPPSITVSVSTHVPKPHTPFQWAAMDPPDEVRKKQGWLREETRRSKVNLRTHDSEGSWLEGVLARGDRRFGRVIERAYRDGAHFDSWDEHLDLDRWRQAIAAEGLEPAMFLGTIPVTARLPWDHIDVGLEEGFLAREYRKALKSRLSPPCGKVAGQFVHATNLAAAHAETRKLVCYDCGVACDLGAMRSERLDYLQKLGAEEPRVRLPLVAPAPPATDGALAAGPQAADAATTVVATPPRNKGKKQHERPPAAFEQGEPRRYRFAYTKLGPSALLSHLDLIRALPRAFRRVDVPLYYTVGFHPKADMSFGPALALGTSSTAEIVDVKITADLDPAALLEALSAGAPRGLDFVGATRLGPMDPSITKVTNAARYILSFARSALDAVGGEAALDAHIATFLAASELPQLRVVEGIKKWVDARKFVRSMVRGGDDARAEMRRAGHLGDLVPIVVDVEIRQDGAVRIDEIVRALLGESPIECVSIRTALGVRVTTPDGAERIASPLELDVVREAVKKPRSSPTADETAPATSAPEIAASAE
ncbi:MAG: TIGR03960 family B12-binding radical SAM protein [Polyangiaceae bacterium]